jgi:hypothetical protein
MLFARIQGSMQWCCPFCGHLNRSSLHYKNSWRIRCSGSDCRRAIAVGVTFYRMVGGFKPVPPDTVMPVEVSREKWHRDQPLNRVVAETEAEDPERGEDG